MLCAFPRSVRKIQSLWRQQPVGTQSLLGSELRLCVSSLCSGHATNHECYRKCFALLLGFECPLHSHPLQAFCTAFARRSAQLGKCHHSFPEKFSPQNPFLEVGLHIVGIAVQWCSHKRFCSGLQVFPRDLQIFEIGASLWL